jgi:hypothetical protein
MLDLGFFTRSRVRLVRQTEIAECGLASLTMVANFHGLDIDLGTMRRRFAPSWAPPVTVDFGQAASICALQAPDRCISG